MIAICVALKMGMLTALVTVIVMITAFLLL